MKNKLTHLFLLTFCLAILFNSCDAGKLNSKADETAIAFYNNLKKKDYNAALGNCSNKAFLQNSKADWTMLFEKNAALLGDMKSFSKTSDFNIAVSTSSGPTVALSYTVEWQYGKSSDSVFLIKEKDGSMKVYRYTFQQYEVAYGKALEESEKKANEYITAVKNNDYTKALTYLSEAALKATPKDKWIAFLENGKNKLGDISNYEMQRDSTTYNILATGAAGKGNYYDVFIYTYRGETKLMEKMIFFQKNYDEPVMLVGHNIDF